jgi:serine/threonine protein kinase
VSSLIAGKYEVCEQLAASPAGTTYKVRHTLLDSVLTLTVLPADLGADEARLARVQRAVRSAFELKHERIVRLLDFGCEDGRYQLVEAFVEGQTLEQVLRARGALPPVEALQIAWQLADALAYAHERGVVHGALTPTTVLLERAAVPCALITGFVVADVEGGCRSTPHYVAPEQLTPAEDWKRDPRSDIFALGLLLFEMLEGKAFFAGMDENQIAEVLRDTSSPLLPRFSRILPSGVSAVAARAMRRVAAERQQGMAQLRREIDACLQRLDLGRSEVRAPVEADAAASPPPPPLPRRSTAASPRMAPGPGPTGGTAAAEPVQRERTVVRFGLVEDLPPAPAEAPETMSAERVVARSLLASAARSPGSRRRLPVAGGALMLVDLLLGWLVLRPARRAPAAPAAAPAPAEAAAPRAGFDVVADVAPAPTTEAAAMSGGKPDETVRAPGAGAEEPVALAPVRTEMPEPKRPPQIASARPPAGRPVSVLEGGIVDFSVRATDRNPDDQLSYAWFLDGRPVGQRPSWRFIAPPAASGPAHEVEVEVTDASGLKAPRVAWNVAVKARMSEANVRDWLDRLAVACESRDTATLRLYGLEDTDAARDVRGWFGLQKRHVSFRNETIRSQGQYASVTVDRVESDGGGKVLTSKRQTFELEKHPNGFIALRAR